MEKDTKTKLCAQKELNFVFFSHISSIKNELTWRETWYLKKVIGSLNCHQICLNVFNTWFLSENQKKIRYNIWQLKTLSDCCYVYVTHNNSLTITFPYWWVFADGYADRNNATEFIITTSCWSLSHFFRPCNYIVKLSTIFAEQVPNSVLKITVSLTHLNESVILVWSDSF